MIAVRHGKQDAFEAITAVIQGICRKTQPDGAVRFCTYVLLERDGE